MKKIQWQSGRVPCVFVGRARVAALCVVRKCCEWWTRAAVRQCVGLSACVCMKEYITSGCWGAGGVGGGEYTGGAGGGECVWWRDLVVLGR